MTMLAAGGGLRLGEDAGHCRFCGRKIGSMGYHYVCHTCGAEYCYVHMARHNHAHAPTPSLVAQT